MERSRLPRISIRASEINCYIKIDFTTSSDIVSKSRLSGRNRLGQRRCVRLGRRNLTISEGLFLTKLEMANDGGDVAKPQASSPGPSGEILAPPKQIKSLPGPSDKVLAPPNQIPAPRHAYGLPLETKFRKAMRKDASMR